MEAASAEALEDSTQPNQDDENNGTFPFSILSVPVSYFLFLRSVINCLSQNKRKFGLSFNNFNVFFLLLRCFGNHNGRGPESARRTEPAEGPVLEEGQTTGPSLHRRPASGRLKALSSKLGWTACSFHIRGWQQVVSSRDMADIRLAGYLSG